MGKKNCFEERVTFALVEVSMSLLSHGVGAVAVDVDVKVAKRVSPLSSQCCKAGGSSSFHLSFFRGEKEGDENGDGDGDRGEDGAPNVPGDTPHVPQETPHNPQGTPHEPQAGSHVPQG
jgi:hypothetical protein